MLVFLAVPGFRACKFYIIYSLSAYYRVLNISHNSADAMGGNSAFLAVLFRDGMFCLTLSQVSPTD